LKVIAMINHSAQPGQHPRADRGADLYCTPPEAVRALLHVEKLPHWIWEPAAGRGAIVNVLRDAGHAVVASDLHDYGAPMHFLGDFLAQSKPPPGVEMILTNPPFMIAERFIMHALDLCPRVAMLLRLAFLESTRRSELIEHRGLARVHVFRNRLPMLHRDGWVGPKASSSIPFGWFCWNRNHTGPTTVDRISWER
jgi:hypothetical protein